MRPITLASLQSLQKNRTALIVLMILAIIFVAKILGGRGNSGGVVLDEATEFEWQPMGISLSNITAMGFDNQGKIGAAASSEGEIIVTRDGGATWHPEGNVPIEDGEMVGAITIGEDGHVFVGSGVDESPYTAIYELDLNGSWTERTGDFGGVAGSSSDGAIFIGGGGFVAQRRGQDWDFEHRLPESAQKMLYGAARDGNQAMVVGDKGVIALSSDDGNSWNLSPIAKNKETFYAAAITPDLMLAGGARGSFWRKSDSDSNWGQIKGLPKLQTIYAIYFDKESKQAIAAGGTDAGRSPFIIESKDSAKTWRADDIDRKNFGRVVAIARGQAGLFIATLDGHILVRKNIS
jgi:photosystem II stability/assembly factor-like uncharacterized protein